MVRWWRWMGWLVWVLPIRLLSPLHGLHLWLALWQLLRPTAMLDLTGAATAGVVVGVVGDAIDGIPRGVALITQVARKPRLTVCAVLMDLSYPVRFGRGIFP